MPQMTGGQALVQQLKMEGIDTIFGLPGIQLDWAFDAIYAEQAHFRVIHTRHEQACAYMADGYARATGKLGLALVVPGPRRAQRHGGALDRLRLLLAGAHGHGPDPQRADRQEQGHPARDPRPDAGARLVTKWQAQALTPAGDTRHGARSDVAHALGPPAPGRDRGAAGRAAERRPR